MSLLVLLLLVAFVESYDVNTLCNAQHIAHEQIGIHKPHFYAYRQCHHHVDRIHTDISEGILLRQFQAGAQWWFQGGNLNKPWTVASAEKLYKRTRQWNTHDYLIPNFDVWMEFSLLEDTDYSAADITTIQVNIVEPSHTTIEDEHYVHVLGHQGGISFIPYAITNNANKVKLERTDHLAVTAAAPYTFTYTLQDEDKRYFENYRQFLRQLKTAWNHGHPFLFPNFNGGTVGKQYYYHPMYIRNYKELYWKIYDVSSTGAINMPLWHGSDIHGAEILPGRVALSVVAAHVNQLSITATTETLTLHCTDHKLKIEVRNAEEQLDELSIYWEEQYRGMCGQHAINNVLGGPKTNQHALNSIARRLQCDSCVCKTCEAEGGGGDHDTNPTGHEGYGECVISAALQTIDSNIYNVISAKQPNETPPYVPFPPLLHQVAGAIPHSEIIGMIEGDWEHWKGWKYQQSPKWSHGHGRETTGVWFIVDSEAKEGPYLNSGFPTNWYYGTDYFIVVQKPFTELQPLFATSGALHTTTQSGFRLMERTALPPEAATGKYIDAGDYNYHYNDNEYDVHSGNSYLSAYKNYGMRHSDDIFSDDNDFLYDKSYLIGNSVYWLLCIDFIAIGCLLCLLCVCLWIAAGYVSCLFISYGFMDKVQESQAEISDFERI